MFVDKIYITEYVNNILQGLTNRIERYQYKRIYNKYKLIKVQTKLYWKTNISKVQLNKYMLTIIC